LLPALRWEIRIVPVGDLEAALKVISEQSEMNIRKKQVRDQLTRDLRKFSANFLRINSGSGKPLDLLVQMENVTASLRAYAEAHDGSLPPAKLVHQILDSRAALIEHRPWIGDVEEESRRRWEADGTYASRDATYGIIKAGMRMIASELVDQLTQHRVAAQDFHRHIRLLDEALEKGRKSISSKR
jgi:hypothetical protein